MKKKIYFWKKNKVVFFTLTTFIVLFSIYGINDRAALAFTALFIVLLLAYGSPLNKAYKRTFDNK